MTRIHSTIQILSTAVLGASIYSLAARRVKLAHSLVMGIQRSGISFRHLKISRTEEAIPFFANMLARMLKILLSNYDIRLPLTMLLTRDSESGRMHLLSYREMQVPMIFFA